MSDNDLIRRSAVLGMLIANYLVGNLAKEALQFYTQGINDIPAVAQGMSAREYGRMREQICHQYQDECCDCPFYYNKCCHFDDLDNRTISKVEKWAREHPERSEE